VLVIKINITKRIIHTRPERPRGPPRRPPKVPPRRRPFPPPRPPKHHEIPNYPTIPEVPCSNCDTNLPEEPPIRPGPVDCIDKGVGCIDQEYLPFPPQRNTPQDTPIYSYVLGPPSTEVEIGQSGNVDIESSKIKEETTEYDSDNSVLSHAKSSDRSDFGSIPEASLSFESSESSEVIISSLSELTDSSPHIETSHGNSGTEEIVLPSIEPDESTSFDGTSEELLHPQRFLSVESTIVSDDVDIIRKPEVSDEGSENICDFGWLGVSCEKEGKKGRKGSKEEEERHVDSDHVDNSISEVSAETAEDGREGFPSEVDSLDVSAEPIKEKDEQPWHDGTGFNDIESTSQQHEAASADHAKNIDTGKQNSDHHVNKQHEYDSAEQGIINVTTATNDTDGQDIHQSIEIDNEGHESFNRLKDKESTAQSRFNEEMVTTTDFPWVHENKDNSVPESSNEDYNNYSLDNNNQLQNTEAEKGQPSPSNNELKLEAQRRKINQGIDDQDKECPFSICDIALGFQNAFGKIQKHD